VAPAVRRVVLPASVQLAFVLWLTAIGAGVFETIIVLVQAINGVTPEENLALGVAVRLVIFAAMTAVIVQLRRGRNWARIVLTIALGVLGSLSLLIGPIEWLSEGHALGSALEGLTLAGGLFMVSRTIHRRAVWSAVALMYVPASNTFFRAAPEKLAELAARGGTRT
jgi:hypothetical protein